MTHAIEIKICGITCESALHSAISAGADDIGFVFYSRSPRHLDIQKAIKLATAARGKIRIVALTVDATDAELASIADAVAPDVFQLHGDESALRVRQIASITGVPVLKAVKVGSRHDIERVPEYEPFAQILFDAKPQASVTDLPGGNGRPFEWSWLADSAIRRDFMLSGGLNAGNVQAAMRASGARSVDVSSGVESRPGVKDGKLIRRFIANAKSMAAARPDPE